MNYLLVTPEIECYKDIYDLLNTLPQWFGIEQSNKEYANQANSLHTILVKENERVVGALSLNEHPNSIDIHLIALSSECQGKGYGHQLINYALDYAKSKNKLYLTVKTLADTHPSLAYKRTRQFYYSCGFIDLEVIPEIWGTQSPCLIMIKQIKK